MKNMFETFSNQNISNVGLRGGRGLRCTPTQSGPRVMAPGLSQIMPLVVKDQAAGIACDEWHEGSWSWRCWMFLEKWGFLILVEMEQASRTTNAENNRDGSRLNVVVRVNGESEGLN